MLIYLVITTVLVENFAMWKCFEFRESKNIFRSISFHVCQGTIFYLSTDFGNLPTFLHAKHLELQIRELDTHKYYKYIQYM